MSHTGDLTFIKSNTHTIGGGGGGIQKNPDCTIQVSQCLCYMQQFISSFCCMVPRVSKVARNTNWLAALSCGYVHAFTDTDSYTLAHMHAHSYTHSYTLNTQHLRLITYALMIPLVGLWLICSTIEGCLKRMRQIV